MFFSVSAAFAEGDNEKNTECAKLLCLRLSHTFGVNAPFLILKQVPNCPKGLQMFAQVQNICFVPKCKVEDGNVGERRMAC